MRWLLGVLIFTGGMFALAYSNASQIVGNEETNPSIEAEVEAPQSDQSDNQTPTNPSSALEETPDPVIETVEPSTDENEEAPISVALESTREELSIDTPDDNANPSDPDSNADNVEVMDSSDDEIVTSSFTGDASWYSPSLAGNPTASGEPYVPELFTAAHRTLEFGTMVRVTRVSSGASVIVRVNDRGPFIEGRVIDVSEAAAEILDIKIDGHAIVRVDVLSSENN